MTTSTTAVQTTRDRSPKKPTDRQPSKSAIAQAEAQPPIGHSLLRPVVMLRSGEIADAQADILDLFGEVGIDLENMKDENGDTPTEVEVENSPHTLRVFGRLGTLLENFVDDEDKEEFIDLDRGPGAGTRMADLAMWYMAELGKSDSSAS